MPPPSQGYLTLAGAAVAEQAGLGADPDDPRWAHLLVEAWRAVGHDRPDVLFDGADGGALLSTERLARAAARVSADRAAPTDVASASGDGAAGVGAGVARIGDGDTTHFCACDADGLGVSLTQSNALDFGSHLVEASTGVFLHNRGVGFSLVEGHPAEVRAGDAPAAHPLPHARDLAGGRARRISSARWAATPSPRSSASCWPACCGPGRTPPRRSARRAWRSTRPPPRPSDCGGVTTSPCSSRPTRPSAWREGLEARGHHTRAISAFDPVAVGCAQIIEVEPDGGDGRRLVAASDPRSPDGAAVGR